MPAMFDSTKPLPVPDIGNTIINAQENKLPFQKLVKRGRAPWQMLQTWPLENYPTDAFDGTMDGADVTAFSSRTRSPVQCCAMLLRTGGVMATKLAQLTKDAGVDRKQEFAKQMTMDGLALARMREAQLLSTMEARIEAAPGTSWRTRGAFRWLSAAAQAVYPVPAAFRPDAQAVFEGALGAFTEERFEAMLEAMATQKGAPVEIKALVGLKLKRAMSNWAAKVTIASGEAATRAVNTDASAKKLVSIIDRFEFDAGVVYSMVSFFLARNVSDGLATAHSARSGLFLDTSMWEIAELQGPQAYQNPDLGGGPRGYHDCVFINKCLNPLGQGYALIGAD